MESIFPFAWIFSACRRRHSVAISACRERDSKGALLLWWDARAKPLDGPGGRTNNPADDLFRSFCGCRARVARVKPCRGIQGGGAHLASLGRCGAASGAKWLAILRNLPDSSGPSGCLKMIRPGMSVVLRFARKGMDDDGIEEQQRSGIIRCCSFILASAGKAGQSGGLSCRHGAFVRRRTGSGWSSAESAVPAAVNRPAR